MSASPSPESQTCLPDRFQCPSNNTIPAPSVIVETLKCPLSRHGVPRLAHRHEPSQETLDSFEIRAISADKVPGVDVPDCRPGPSVNSQIRWKGRVSLPSPAPCAGTTHHGKRRRWCDERSAGPDTSGGRHDPAGEAQRQHPRRALLTRRGCCSGGTPVRQSGGQPGSMHR